MWVGVIVIDLWFVLASLCVGIIAIDLWLFLAARWIGLQSVFVVFPDHTRFFIMEEVICLQQVKELQCLFFIAVYLILGGTVKISHFVTSLF